MSKKLVLVGTQWGDEGKGKIVDLLTEKADVVVRFQGGHNAGHTLVIGGQKNSSTFDPIRHSATDSTMLYRKRRGIGSRCINRRNE